MKSNRLNQLMSFLEASPEDSFILFAIAKEYEKGGKHETGEEFIERQHLFFIVTWESMVDDLIGKSLLNKIILVEMKVKMKFLFWTWSSKGRQKR